MADRDLRGFLAFGVGRGLATFFGVVAAALVGRLLGPDVLGRWMLLAAAGALLHTALINWTHASTVRFGREEWVRASSFHRTLSARLPMLGSSLAVATVLLLAEPGNWLQRWFGVEAADRWMVALFALNVWLTAEAQATLQAAGKLARQALVASVVGGLSVVVVMALLWSGQRSLASAVIAVNLLPIAAWGGTWLRMLWRSRRSEAPAPPIHTPAEHLRYGWPLVPGFALGYLASFGAPLLLGRLSSMTNVGLYGLSYQFVAAVIAANSVLTTFLLPWLIRRHVEDPKATRDYVDGAVPTLYTLWMIATVWLVAVLPIALAVFTGDQFRSAQPILLILLVAVPPSVITSLYTILFDVQGRLGRVVIYMVPTTVANIACCVVLIPTYGVFGAAVATALSTAAGQALYIWDQHRHLHVAPARVWGLWATGLALGVAQVAIGVGIANRLIWAVVGTLTLSGMVRRAACVDGLLVRQLLGNRLNLLARVINRVLVAEA